MLRDPSRGVYKRVVLRDNRIVGAVLYGDTADGAWYFDLLKNGADVADMHDTLIFGQAYQGGGPLDPVAPSRRCRTMRRSAAATASARARSPAHHRPRADDPRRRAGATKASASCGHCTGKVEQLLVPARRGLLPAAGKPMCKCTDLTHEEVRG